jgi:hypothetical protein
MPHVDMAMVSKVLAMDWLATALPPHLPQAKTVQ